VRHPDAGVTSLAAELDRPVAVEEVVGEVGAAVLAALDGELAVTEHAVARPGNPGGAGPAPARRTALTPTARTRHAGARGAPTCAPPAVEITAAGTGVLPGPA
jgi:hypothetical protein